MFGAVNGLRKKNDWSIFFDEKKAETEVAAARAKLGEEKFASLWAEGRSMSMDEAIEYALDEC